MVGAAVKLPGGRDGMERGDQRADRAEATGWDWEHEAELPLRQDKFTGGKKRGTFPAGTKWKP